MRLIDADKAQKQLDMAIANNNNPLLLATEIKEFLEVQPTVEERKHGHWKFVANMLPYHLCSVCGRRALFDENSHDTVMSNYCPYCGAVMDEEA